MDDAIRYAIVSRRVEVYELRLTWATRKNDHVRWGNVLRHIVILHIDIRKEHFRRS